MVDKQRQASAYIETTPEMIAAGVRRMRESLDESQQLSADFVVVLEILESALSARAGAHQNFRYSCARHQILAYARGYL
jgi:hypothetical protein